ncbi:ciliogenesis and planar polarity effector 1 isoform X4 [Girardinichthys multiradiatus]|uniref:ciliogenesis and planar polarity effector 1 isoform X4 n=1 Tax=Girardinichthys multiradiatus TaxID=208333 RepID=UPI001FACC939|nr:ciliogenesis and planar polarity effector 1 isoform X4 [Girardinichthys multiradiatus]
MELKLEVVLSSSIKRKKPWPRFCWLGQEKESVFLLDDKRISEINMVSGRTKKRTPKLHSLLSSVVKMASSHNGMWLCGLLVSGELFLWNRDKDLLKTATGVDEIAHMINSAQGDSLKLCLQVSCDGMRVLLAAISGQVFLWECTEGRYFLPGLRDGPVKGRWAHLLPLKETILPSTKDKEASQHTIFVNTEVMADICLSAFVFTSGKQLVVTILKIQWSQGSVRIGSVGYNIQWSTKKYPMSHLCPPCQPVKSRGALLPAFSPDGRLLAIVLNQRKPKDTQVLFVSTQNFVSVSSDLGGCGSKKMDIPSKYVRSYWVGSVSWSAEGLFFACVLKRGSLLMLARLGGLLTLTSSGCNVDFGPAQFLPLHPLVTYRPSLSAENGEICSSSLSVRDLLRQRFSVTWHPRLLYLIVSDGYMATVMKVQDRHSPALFLKALLNETCKDLEKASCQLEKSQVHVKAWLESMSWFNSDSSLEELSATVTCRPKGSESTNPAAKDPTRLPLFLQDQQTLGGTKELLESMQAFFEEESDLEGLPAGSHVLDGGRLDFASMFDTLHAMDSHSEFVVDTNHKSGQTEKKNPLYLELGKIQRKLLTAWAFAMSVGDAVEHRVHLLKHTLCCVVWFAALLHLVPPRGKNTSVFARLLHLIKSLLSFLSWDSPSSDGQHCLGLMVEFSEWIVRLLLTPQPDIHLTGHCLVSSQSLSRILQILLLVSDSLDCTYSLEQKTDWSSEEEFSSSQPHLWPSDVHDVPLLQDVNKDGSGFEHQALPFPQRPSSRLVGVWQLVYDITQQYTEELKRFKGFDGLEEEEQRLSVITSQIQTTLQATGENLEEGHSLLSYQGEHLFLCGLFSLSTQMLRTQICQEASKGGNRSVFQETRLCLALLYSLLSQYHLREAQEFGDHMAQLILLKAGNQTDNWTCNSDPLPCPWLPMDLPSDAVRAVVQALGRFMASYFTNQPLFILPAHNVAVLPPLHLPHASSIGRLVPLYQEEVAKAVRQQHLSEVWTVDYAHDLLLLGGLLPEAVWLASHLGDWKTAVTLSLAYTSYCTKHFDFTQLRRRDFLLPTELQPESIFQAELRSLLGSKTDSWEWTDKDGNDCFTDPLEGEDWELLQASVHEILKASTMAGVNVMSFPLSTFLDKAKYMCSSMPTLVPTEVYLPSPPLYCPQPSPNTQDQMGETEEFAEVVCRHKVSRVLQRLLLLLSSAHCSRPAAQWYISRLRRARHILHKIQNKYSYPSAAQEENTFPEGLMKMISRSGYFRRDPKKDGHLDPDTIQTIICFRELCALCWMLHVRDQLSLHCRKYQAARQCGGEEAIPEDSQVNSFIVDALHWACRLLPFTHFLGGEEVLQDIMLSLLSELPPVSLVADTLVRAFPQEEESVRVSLREKYNLLLQRLGQCNLLEGAEDGNESMMIFIQDRKRHRRKHLARLQRHLAPPVLHLWEKADEQEGRGGRNDMATLGQLSLGTTVSTSTLTDGAFQPVCSDADTAVNTPENISPKLHHAAMSRSKEAHKDDKRMASKMASVLKENTLICGEREMEQLSLPEVGSWEFELEDEEYLHFLELFLSYVLEKDTMDCGDELPLLRGFCFQLREKELHSLTFDVVSTIHRRQRGVHILERKHSGKPPSVFRAGSCYKPITQDPTPELQTSSVWSEDPISRASNSVRFHPGRRTEKQKGLFGLWHQSSISPAGVKEANLGSETSFVQNAFTTEHPSERLIPDFSSCVRAVTDLQQGLDPELEARFPELGRLLEWMVRWADRRILLGHHGKKKKGKAGEPDEGVVIRVTTTAPAILTSLGLLGYRYAAQPQTDHYTSYNQVPEMQWTVAPVLYSDVEGKTEKESSVDTGYPGSANTPITGPDHNVQNAETSLSSVTDERKEQTFPPPEDQVQLSFDSHQRHPGSPQQMFNDFDGTPEKEDRSGNCEDVDVLQSDSSEDTSKDVCTPETSLKLEDLDYSEKDSVSSSSSHIAPVNIKPPAPPTVHTKPPRHAESSDLGGVALPNPDADQTRLQPQISTAGVPPADSATSTQPLITFPMRQRLGEDLFRLVQHINYMSLSEVLGATFSSLQLAQQSSASGMDSSQPNMHLSSTSQIIPEPNAFPVQTTTYAVPQTQACVPKSKSGDPQLNQTESCHFAAQPVMQGTGATLHHSEMQPLSVQAESPEIQRREKKRLIPSSHGLLATTDSSQHLPSENMPQTASAPQMLGLKLLKLHHSATSQHIPPHYATQHSQTLHTANLEPPESSQPQGTYDDQSTWKKKGGQERNGFSVQTKHLIFNSEHNLPPKSSHPPIWPSAEPVGQAFPLLLPALPSSISAPMHGLRLLQLQDVPRSSITFPKLTTASAPRPAVISAGMTEASIIRLLHIEPGPKMMVPQEIPSNSMGRLIGEFSSGEILRQGADVAQLQLPRRDRSDEKLTSSPSLSSSKRQRRREEKAKGRKTEVSFHLYESIVPTKEAAAHVPESEEAAEIKPAQDMTGSSDHLLTGKRLLDKAFSTSAELHAFASISKRPLERHDAFTNTEPALTSTLENKSVSVQASVMTSSPKMLSPKNFTEEPVRDAVEDQRESERFLDFAGRQFISVLDLEDVRQHEDLLPGPSSAARDVPSSPTSAQLHVLATSVISSAAAAEPQSSAPVPNDLLKPRTTTEVPEASPSFSHSESSGAAERIALQDDAMVDSAESEICRATKAQRLVPDRAPSSPSSVWFYSRLSELDSQLAALQNIADHLEMDFSNSRMLVNTIEKLSSDRESDAKVTTGVKKSVRLSAPLKAAWTSRPDPDLLPALKECDENKEEQEEEHVLHDDSGRPATKPSLHRSASFCQSGGSSYLHIDPGIKEHFVETCNISHEWADRNLGQTELSDTVEILDELVKEGYLSPSDWDLDPSQTARQSRRQEHPQHSWTSQKGTILEEERKDLRIWMRRKQRERLAAYQKHRQTLRERENKPFSTSSTGRSPNRRQASSGRNREETEKSMLLKHYYQRTQEAFSLANDVPASPVTTPSSSQTYGPPGLSSTWSISAPPPGNPLRPLIVSANDKKSPKFQSEGTPPCLRYSVERGPSEDLRRRLGLHRPVTFLPGDRLSQVTRRGMLSNTKGSQSKLNAASQSQAQHVGVQTKTGFNSSFSSRAALQRGNLREQKQVKKPEVVKRSELTRLEAEEDSTLVLGGILEGQDGAVTGGVSEMYWLDDLSDSAGSSLSRIDWAAIEKMVAVEED